MKGNHNQHVIDILNEIKQGELTAILTFLAHGDLLKNMGLEALAKMYEKEAVEEMGHNTRFAERIYFLGGKPKTMPLKEPDLGRDLPDILKKDAAMEKGQIERIQRGVKIAWEAGDPGSRTLMEEILTDEEHHFAQLSQMSDNLTHYGMGFLACICGQGVPMAVPPGGQAGH